MLAGGLAQECLSGSEIPAATATAVTTTAQRFYDLSARGDVAALKSEAMPEVEANFGGIEQAVIGYKSLFAEAPPSDTRIFVLDATNSKTNWQRADFYCGIYNSPDRVGISIPNLPPGRYALTIAKSRAQDPVTLTMILQDAGDNSWKLAGYYARANSLAGHDGTWFEDKAREYLARNERLNAWLYYLTAWDLLAPVDFISTPQLDKLNDALQATRPTDVPTTAVPLVLSSGGKSFKVDDFSVVAVGTEFYIQVKYDAGTRNDPALLSQDNLALMKAVLAKYPELRSGFGGVFARATYGGGREFATITAMKEIQ